MNTAEMSNFLCELVERKLGAVEVQFPGLVLPHTYAGHPVGDDAYSHLLKALTILSEFGVERIGDVDVRARSSEIANATEPSIEGFSSFSFGESLARLGGLARVEDAERAIAAVRDPELVRRILENDSPPPPNWVIVAARCLAAEEALTGNRPAELDDFLERTIALITQRSSGWVNDMWAPLVHFDMYTPDMYVFAEPLRADLESAWDEGFRNVINDLDHLAQPGGAVPWGRSSGLLALAMTVEIAAYGARHSLLGDETPWLERARLSVGDLDRLMPGGIVAAHQRRATMSYRGPGRRLQMSFDLLDKLAASALRLQHAPLLASTPRSQTWPFTDTIVEFDPETGAAAWGHRSRSLSFSMPFMRGFSSDYQASPRSPGVFEVPTEGHPCFLPQFFSGGNSWTPAGLPTTLEQDDSGVTIEHTAWATPGGGPGEFALGGSRRAVYRVAGRQLHVAETIEVDEPGIEEVTVTVPQVDGRRLDVTAEDDVIVRQVDTSGIAEWRSYWNELPKVHQIEIPLDNGRAETAWTVRPQLRVGSTIHSHPYDDALYRPLAERLHAVAAPMPGPDLFDGLRNLDILHIGWPEHWAGTEPGWNQQVIETVKDAGVPIVWTQHNLISHFVKTDDSAACYQAWAEAADAVIHHSECGARVACETYDYGPVTRHVVIPHGHWGHQYGRWDGISRELAEMEFRWSPVPIRLAVVGMPRKEKRLQDVLDAFAATDRDDIELVIRLEGGEIVPDDPRIRVEYLDTPGDAYLRRMNAFDALILPFDSSGMLTTGTAFDAMGAGLAAITSDWDFLDETFEGADIRYGSTTDDLRDCLQNLTIDALDESKRAIVARRPHYDWEPIAESTFELFEDLVP